MTAARLASGTGAVAANQDHKRAQIIEAARAVLSRDGLAGVTVRAVADAGPLTKSAVHYYFRDVHQIVDLAVAAHLQTMLQTLRTLAGEHADPDHRLRAVLRAYLDTFAEKPHAAFLWFEYWIDAGRRGHPEPVKAMLDDIECFLDDLLAATTEHRPTMTSRSLLSWLLGTVVQQHVRPLDPAHLDAEIETLLTGSRTDRAD